MTQPAGPHVLVTCDGPRVDVHLDRPDKLNALTREMLDGLAGLWSGLGPGVRVVVLGSTTDRAFCAGADLVAHAAQSPDAAVDTSLAGGRALRSVSAAPVPVVARLTGHCLGGGLELALACDLRVADTTAVLGFPEVPLGHLPAWGGLPRLVALLGPARAKDLLLTGRRLSAQEALAWGLVDRVAQPGELDAVLAALTATIAEAPARAVAAARLAVENLVAQPNQLLDALGAGFFARTADPRPASRRSQTPTGA